MRLLVTGLDAKAAAVVTIKLPVHSLDGAVREGVAHHLQLLIADEWKGFSYA